jgi:hypothetical protein
MVTISITAEAFEAIKASLSVGVEADMRPDGKGGFHITLPRDLLDRLKALRGHQPKVRTDASRVYRHFLYPT